MQAVEEVEQQRDGDQADEKRETQSGVHGCPALNLFDHDAVDLVGDVVEAVGDLFQVIVDLRADDVVHGVGAAMLEEQLLEPDIVQVVDAALRAWSPLR